MIELPLYGDDPNHASYYHGIFDARYGTIRLSDEQIMDAYAFEGWHAEYLRWDRSHWKNIAKGVPCHDPEKNAYHVRYLAETMLRAGGWIGQYDAASPDRYHAWPLVVQYGTRGVRSGNHRLRAWRYLITTRGLMLDVPLASWR